MNVLPILEMFMSNELFIFLYESILDENIFLACWTFAKTVEGKGSDTCIRCLLFSFETQTNSVPMLQV